MHPPSGRITTLLRDRRVLAIAAVAIAVGAAVAFLMRGGSWTDGGKTNDTQSGIGLPIVNGPGSFQTMPDGRIAFVADNGGRIDIPVIDGLELVQRDIDGKINVLYVARTDNPYGIAAGSTAGYFNPEVFVVDHRSVSPRETRLGGVGLAYPVYEMLRERDRVSWALNVDPTTGSSKQFEMKLYLADEGFQVRVPLESSVINPIARTVKGDPATVRVLRQTSVVTALNFIDALIRDDHTFDLIVAVALSRQDARRDDPGLPSENEEITPEAGSTLLRVENGAVDAAFIEQVGKHRFPSLRVNVMVLLTSYETTPTTVFNPDTAFFGFAGPPGPIVHLLSTDSPLLGPQ